MLRHLLSDLKGRLTVRRSTGPQPDVSSAARLVDQAVDAFSSATDSENLGHALSILDRPEVVSYLSSASSQKDNLCQQVLSCFLRLTADFSRDSVDLRWLALPSLFESVGWAAPSAALLAYRDRLDKEHLRCREAKRSLFAICLLELVACGLTQGRGHAVVAFFRRVDSDPALVLVHKQAEAAGIAMQRHGWYDAASTGDQANWLGNITFPRADPQENYWFLYLILKILRFHQNAPLAWNRWIFLRGVLPWLAALRATSDYNSLLMLENLFASHYLKCEESVQHFEASWKAIKPVLCAAGREASAALPPGKLPALQNPPKKIAFCIPRAALLAHTQVFLSLLEGLAELEQQPFEPVLFIMQAGDDQLLRRLDQLGCTYVILERLRPAAHGLDLYSCILELREQLRERQIPVLLFVIPASMLFSFAMRIAPVQIWWTSKYQHLQSDDIDGYLAYGTHEEYRNVNGVRWHVHESAVPSAESTSEIVSMSRAERAKYGRYRLVVGSLVREEKLLDERFLDAVATLLEDNPDIVYVYTGKENPGSVQRFFQTREVADRCVFVGWLAEPKIYANVIDIFLDSFPFPAGHTAVYAMAAEKPIVFYKCEESLTTGVLKHVWPAFSGQAGSEEEQRSVGEIFRGMGSDSLLLAADDPRQYVALAQRLIDDEAWRRKVGIAGRRFFVDHFSDSASMARSFYRHIREIVNETASRGSPGQPC